MARNFSRTSRYSPRLGSGYTGTQTQTLTPEDYRPGATTSTVLWRWNETDATQLGTRVVPCTLNTTPISSETLSVVSSSPSVGSRLRFQLTFSTSSTTTNAGLWPLLDSSGAAFQLPDRFLIRMRFRNVALTNMTNLFFGFGLWNNSTSTPYGAGIAQHSAGNATVVVRLQASDAASATRPWLAMSTTGAGGTWQAANNVDHAGSAYTWAYSATQGSGGNPWRVNATYESVAGGGKSDQTPFTLVPAVRSAAGQAFQSIGGAIDAGYNNQVCNYPMFFVLAQTAAGTPSADFSVSDMEILTHPMDLP